VKKGVWPLKSRLLQLLDGGLKGGGVGFRGARLCRELQRTNETIPIGGAGQAEQKKAKRWLVADGAVRSLHLCRTVRG
jgi:hypothetical protein